MAEDKEIVEFELKVQEFKNTLNGLADQVNSVDGNVKGMSNNFSKAGKNIEAQMHGSTAAAKTLGKAVSDAQEEVKKIARAGSLKGLQDELKKVKDQMSSVKAGGTLFKALDQEAQKLQTRIQAVTKEAPTLRAQYKQALLDIQNGVEGAAERAGQLKDQIDDANESASALASGSKFEQFGNVLGNVSGKLANLDFEGAAEQAKLLEKVSSEMTFKEAIDGVKNLGSSFASLGKALLTNPMFLVAGALAGIGAAIYSLITAEDEQITKIKELEAAQQSRFEEAINGIDTQIAREQALGNVTIELEQQRRILQRERLKEQIANTEELYRQETKVAIQALMIAGRTREEAQKEVDAANAETVEKQKQLSQDLINNERDINVERLKLITGSLQSGIKETGKTAEEENKIFDQRNKNHEKFLADRAKQEEEWRNIERARIEGEAKDEEERLRLQLEQDNKAKQDAQTRQQETQRALDEQFRAENTEAQTVIDEAELERIELMNQARLDAEKRLSDAMLEINATLASTIAQGFSDVYSAIGANEEAVFIVQKAVALAKLFIDQQKTMSALTVAQAEALANPLVASNPAAIAATTAFYTAQRNLARVQFGIGVATIGAQTIAKFNPVQAFAEGTPFVTGGKPGKDSVPAMLMPAEAVIPADINKEYHPHIKALLDGTYDDYLKLNYIAPALAEAYAENKRFEQASFADNIAQSLLLNASGGKFKDHNIIRALTSSEMNENKRHRELVAAINANKTVNLRKL